MKSWSWILVILLIILIKWASWYPAWIEQNYTNGVYPLIAKTLRLLLGWIPFSIGDFFYVFLGLVFIYKTAQLFRAIRQKKMNRNYLVEGLQQFFFFILFIYVLFNLCWGLNYNRLGIAHQTGIKKEKYSTPELDTLTRLVQFRLNELASDINDSMRGAFKKKNVLFDQTTLAYEKVSTEYTFLNYTPASIKPSIFSYLGNVLGFQGYYNPFSGEAQVNTTVPGVLEPFVTAHEVAHQLGYGKENEASFVAYLATRNAPSSFTRYSLYFDMYVYCLSELRQRDSTTAKNLHKQLHPTARKDFQQVRQFYSRYKNPIEPLISWMYGNYLKANNQPEGRDSYNHVVGWLMGYYKKKGEI